ncbi:MAG: type II toxin-antitoxin system VapC family toxin [Anaerolineales bacterium]|nr:type II toxin-antitoxin system VapC family toxin [Anaerolineales bacterium]
MNVLLDTQAFLWWDWQFRNLSQAALLTCQNSANTLMLSIASIWEMQIKVQLGKLQVGSLEAKIDYHQQQGMILLSVLPKHIYTLDKLPFHHKDPFDRIIIAQAHYEGLPIVTSDPYFPMYPIRVIW